MISYKSHYIEAKQHFKKLRGSLLTENNIGSIDNNLGSGSIDNNLGSIDNNLGSNDNNLVSIDNNLGSGSIDNNLGSGSNYSNLGSNDSNYIRIKNEYMIQIKEYYKKHKTSGSIRINVPIHESILGINSYSTVYGELTYEGIEKLENILKQKNITIFMDIGSGNGKIPIIIAMCDIVKLSFGVELVPERYNNAMILKNNLLKNKRFFEITKKIEFINDDMFNLNYNKISQGQTSLVFISNLCFSEPITYQLFKKLQKELSVGSIVASSKIPLKIPDKFKPMVSEELPNIFLNNGSAKFPMTWSNTSTLYFHKLVQ